MLTRPIFTASVTAFVAALMAVSLSSRITLPLVCIFLVLAVVCLILRRKKVFGKSLAFVLLTAAVTALYTLYVLTNTLAPILRLDGQQAVTDVRVNGATIPLESSVMIPVEFQSVAIVGAPGGFDGYLYSDAGLDLAVGDRMTCEVTFHAVSDYMEDKYYSEGRYITATPIQTVDILHTNEIQWLERTLAQIRTFVTEHFAKHLNRPEAAFLSGLTMNDKSRFTDEMSRDFSRSGIAHIVAVSGMHLTVLCGVLGKLLERLRVNKRIAALILIPFIILMILLVGAPYSAVRSGIMVILTLLGAVFFKKTDALTSLGVAALLIIAFQPLAVVSLSFQLSFAATLGLIVLSGRIDRAILAHPTKWRWLNWLIGWLSPIFSVSVAAALFTLPVLALQFENVPAVAPFTNLFLLFTVSLALVLGLLSALCAPIGFLSMPLLFTAGLLSKYILAVAQFFGDLSFATWSFASAIMKLALSGAILLLGIALFRSPRRRTVTVALLLGATLLFSTTLIDQVDRQNTVCVRVYPSDSGIAATFVRGRDSVLVGTGDGDCLYQAETDLQRLGIEKFHTVLLPDLDDTFANGWKTLIRSTEYDIIIPQGSGEHQNAFASVQNGVELQAVDSIEPLADVRMDIIRTDAGNGALVDVFGRKLLIAKENFDSLKAELLICTLPAEEGIGAFDSVIICGEGTKGAVYAQKIQDQTGVYLADRNGLELKFAKDGSYTLRRIS